MAVEEISLDVREMEPPEPYELATSTLRDLKPGQYIRMISVRRPIMLYPWLEEQGFNEDTRQRDEDLFDIYIWAIADTETGDALTNIIK